MALPDDARCLGCGCPLAQVGDAGACPECGRGCDANLADSFCISHVHPRPPLVARTLLVAQALAASATAGIAIAQARLPGSPLGSYVWTADDARQVRLARWYAMAEPTFLALAGLGLLLGVALLIRGRRRREPAPGAWLLLIAPFALAAEIVGLQLAFTE